MESKVSSQYILLFYNTGLSGGAFFKTTIHCSALTCTASQQLNGLGSLHQGVIELIAEWTLKPALVSSCALASLSAVK